MSPYILPLDRCIRPESAGGKAVNLGALLRAGLPVPDGFAITTEAFRAACRSDGALPQDVRDAILSAWEALVAPTVAVRSSATVEDAPGASMAGQFETILGISSADDLLEAVQRCWQAVNAPRVQAYLAEKGLRPAQLAMAVVVQRLVDPEAAGVLFTVNPRTGDADEMLVEASWGLGESVVSGEVQPDAICLDAADGAPRAVHVGTKATTRSQAHPDPAPTPPERAARLCLDSSQLHAIWQLGRKAVHALGGPQDIEWAVRGAEVFLLQSRPITTLEGSPAAVRRAIAEAAAAGRGPWVRHNLSETLPQPTPLTWSIIRRFMSGAGGYGALQRKAGYAPSALADEQGVLDLWGGRIYLDLSRAGEMFCERFAFRYDEALLRSNPSAAQERPTVPCGTASDRARTARLLANVTRSLARLAESFPREWETRIVPEWRTWIAADPLSVPGCWRDHWEAVERKVLGEFAPDSLLPGFLAAWHLEALKPILREHFVEEDPDELALRLAAGGPPDETLSAAGGLWRMGRGQMQTEEWIARYGHRAPGEFDLAAPRWREIPDRLLAAAKQMAAAEDPLERHARESEKSETLRRRLAEALPPRARAEFEKHVAAARCHTRLREDAKFELMRGYELLRRLALAAADELDLGEGVFFLTKEELFDAVGTGLAPLERIARRRAERAVFRGISLPLFLDGSWARGEDPAPSEGMRRAFPISSGVAEGPVRIVLDPLADKVEGDGFILVCPSTDPSWTPLFTRAAGLVLECGGALSHGAVVARELGLPAVVLEGATSILRHGDVVRVDGSAGAVGPAGEPAAAPARLLPTELPPPPDSRERAGARAVFWGFLGSGLLLAAVYLLPSSWLLDPVYRLLDSALLPLWRQLGLLAVPAVLAGFFALAVTLGQRVLTPVARLNLAKRRAEHLRQRALAEPPGSALAASMTAAAKPVTGRILVSSLVPLTLLIAPMVLSFTWMAARLDPASWPPPPDSTIHLTASVDGDYLREIRLEHDPALSLAASTPPLRSAPPIRPTLVNLLAELKATAALPEESAPAWPILAAASQARDAMLADLEAYLARPMPPAALAWSLHSPNVPGEYWLQLLTEGNAPVRLRVALGAGMRPEPRVPDGANLVQLWENPDPAHPIRRARIAFSGLRVRGADTVWQPFAPLGWTADFGWLGAYLAFYLPPFFLLRWALRLP